MPITLHTLLFVSAIAATWWLSGILIAATDRLARRYHYSGFAIAFFVLGFLTSIGEASVAVNATIRHVPQVSVGNLVGASVMIILFIIPLLAVIGNGVETAMTLKPHNLILLSFLVLLPPLFALNGTMSRAEGGVLLLVYAALIVLFKKKNGHGAATIVQQDAQHPQREENRRRATVRDLWTIVVGGILIFFAGRVLVDETVFFAQWFQVPMSFVGLMVLAFGTNIPELGIGMRSILGGQKSIAFGNHLGSTAANSAIMAVLLLLNGTFTIQSSTFLPIVIILGIGLVLLLMFAYTQASISRNEGLVLLVLYIVFVGIQSWNIMRIVPQVEGKMAVMHMLLQRAGV